MFGEPTGNVPFILYKSMNLLKKFGLKPYNAKHIQRFFIYHRNDIPISIALKSNRNTRHKLVLALKQPFCTECGTTENLSQDHVIPRSHGGAHSIKNKQILCVKCNSKKGNSFIH